MNKKKIVIGNWKMNPLTSKEAEKLFSGVVKLVSKIKKTEIVACPPVLYIEKLKNLSKKISLGAQNTFWEEYGAFTGEISPEMLYGLGVKYVILGHSERRALGEDNSQVNKKIRAALGTGLIPIFCLGEKERDENHEYLNFVKKQIEEGLASISKDFVSKIIIAYEPVWAISSTLNRKNATPDDSREMIVFIRKILSDKFGKSALDMRIIYGGSVSSKDALGFLQEGGADGLLVGKNSLDAKKFVEIINITEGAL